MKDLPDIALLASVRGIEGAQLREAIDQTFSHRETHRPPRSTPPPPGFWKPIYARMAAVDRLPWGSLSELHAKVAAFLDPALTGAPVTWDPSTWTWSGESVSR